MSVTASPLGLSSSAQLLQGPLAKDGQQTGPLERLGVDSLPGAQGILNLEGTCLLTPNSSPHSELCCFSV